MAVRRWRPRVAVIVLAATAAASTLLSPAAATRSAGRGACADTTSPSWPSLNLDLENTRHQRASSVTPDDVPRLEPAWVFSARAAGLGGKLLSTPIVAGGCVFLALNDTDQSLPPDELGSGRVVALDAADGSVIWVREVNGNPTGLAVSGGRVFAFPQQSTVERPGTTGPAGPHAIAFDQRTGDIAWVSKALGASSHDPATGSSNGHYINASPVVFDGMIFVPLALGAGDGKRVPLYLLNAHTGAVVKEIYAITEEEAAIGYGGAGAWTTAAVDTGLGYLYVGTADSEGYRKQHPHNNAILKIDVKRGRSTFGTVVAHYKGTPEQYVGSIDDTQNPACGALQNAAPGIRIFDRSAEPTCGELDLDFGGSPTLARQQGHAPMVVELQKSGVLHGVEAGGMTGRWSKVISHPTFAGNSSTGAFDGRRYFTTAGPNVLMAVDPWSGDTLWSAATADVVRYHPLTVANGVLYTTSNFYLLEMFDAATGRLLSARSLDQDSGEFDCREVAGGVSIAGDTIYVPCDWHGALVAYRPRR